MVRILTIIAFLSITLTVHGQHEPDPYAKARAEYRVRISKVATDDVPGLLAVATWCREAKLYGEMRKVAKKVVGIRPDHAQARTLLGEMKVSGRWLKKTPAMKELGYVRYKNRWHTLDQYARLKADEGQLKRTLRIQREVDRLVRRMASRSDTLRDRARDDLVSFARQEELGPLIPKARALHAELARYWARVRAHETATVEVRLQKAELVRLRSFTTSLGTGQPVTLELPEVKRISLGTTVLVPVR
ncbi:MAG: hypothetical protein HRU14_02540 [Planctomycetes bacterium]|nr:hypothetical protein [Planctomycetota bacterium]